jgi:serine/threonine protein kinase
MNSATLRLDPQPTNCPTPPQLKRWLEGDEQPSAEQSDHLGKCPRCLMLLDQYSEDDVLAQWQRHSKILSRSEYAGEAALKRLQSSLVDSSTSDRLSRNSFFVPGSIDRKTTTQQSTAHVRSTEVRSQDVTIDLNFNPESLQALLPQGRFVVMRLIARGGAGSVFLAFDNQLERNVAIKVLSRNSLRDRKRFAKEARALAEIDHPNVVRVFDVGLLESATEIDPSESSMSGDHATYIVLEYVDGGTVVDSVPAKGSLSNSQAIIEMARLFASAADGLAAAHTVGVVHRDVKPANLLFDRDANELKVADFGLAHFTDRQTSLITRTGDILGTPAFMSPEQIESESVVTPKTDIYSLAAAAYTVFSGVPPYQGSTAAVLRQIAETAPTPIGLLNAAVPPDLAMILHKAMQREPNDRYPTIAEFAADLKRFTQGQSVDARPLSSSKRLLRYCQRNRSFALALFSIAALASCLLIGSMATALVLNTKNAALVIAAKNERNAKRQAEQALVASLDATDQMLLKVSNDAELLPSTPGSQAIRLQLLQQARDYYQSFLASNQSNAAIQLQLARARIGLSKVSNRLGDIQTSESESSQAIQALESMRKADPQSIEVAEQLFFAIAHRGQVLADRGDTLKSVQYFEQAAAIYERDLRGEKSSVLTNAYSNLLRQRSTALAFVGDEKSARSDVDKSVALASQLAESFPDSSVFQRDLALAKVTSARLLLSNENVEQANQELQSALKTLDALYKQGANGTRMVELLASSRLNFAQSQMLLGQFDAALQSVEQATNELEQLIRMEPKIPRHKFTLAEAAMKRASLLFRIDQVAGAIAASEVALEIMNPLLAGDPSNDEYLSTTGLIQSNLAILMGLQGETEQAIARLVAANEPMMKYAQQHNWSAETTYPIALNHYQIGQNYMALDDADNSLAAFQESGNWTKRILDASPNNLDAREHMIDVLLAQSDTLYLAETIDGAAVWQYGNDMIQRSQKLVSDEPEVGRFQYQLGLCYTVRGDASWRLGDLEAATADAQAIFELIEATESEDLRSDLDSAKAYAHLILACVAKQQLKATEDATQKEMLIQVRDQNIAAAKTLKLDPEEFETRGLE